MQSLVRSEKITTINQLRSVLETFQRPLPLPELLELTSRLHLPRSHWQTDLVFDAHRFCFRTLYASPHFEINIIGWKPGQSSSVHDHSGTACCVLVLDGILTNRDYQIVSSNQLHETSELKLRPGEILARSDCDIHRCANEQTDAVDLATLHLYSPPLRPLSERQH